MRDIEKIFTTLGGTFCSPYATIATKAQAIKAFVFDWDGVFNPGVKQGTQGSPFNEIDAMGTNLLRFAYYLYSGQQPVVAIISGETNAPAVAFGKRERFHALYSQVKHKTTALQHLLEHHGLSADQVAFVFDDVLDISIARMCGLRILINRQGSPLFRKYILQNKLADYITAQPGGNFAVREACELLMGLLGNFNSVIDHRTSFSAEYQEYLAHKERIDTAAYAATPGGEITPAKIT